VHHEHHATRDQTPAALLEGIAVFPNRKWLRRTLDYMSPQSFAARLNPPAQARPPNVGKSTSKSKILNARTLIPAP
jgi:hypothetical protein